MGIIIGGVSPKDLIMDGKSVSLYVGGNPPEKVWPTGPDVVQITLGTGLQARDQFRAALTKRGLDHATITEVPFEIELVGTGSAQNMFESCWELISVPDLDTSGVTNMSNMFSYCTSITRVPDLDTSSVTNMSGMFTTCSALTHAPVMDTSNVTDMYSMFSGCGSLTHVPDMDTSKVTNTDYMFFVCNSLTDGNVRLIGKHPSVSTSDMISYSGLTREPFYLADGRPWRETVQIATGSSIQAQTAFRRALSDRGLDYRTITEIPFYIELVGSGSVQSMFAFCSALTSVPDINTEQVTNVSYMFQGCSSLTDGNVRLIGRHQNVSTTGMISSSGLTREPWYTVDGDPIISLTRLYGNNRVHPLTTVTVPTGETWNVRIQGTVTHSDSSERFQPFFRIGATDSGVYGQGGVAVDFSGTITAANATIALVTQSVGNTDFIGTVTIKT